MAETNMPSMATSDQIADATSYKVGDDIALPLFIHGYASTTTQIRFYLPTRRNLLNTTSECKYVADFDVSKICKADATNVTIPSSPTWSISKNSDNVLQIAITNVSGCSQYAEYYMLINRSGSNARIMIEAYDS